MSFFRKVCKCFYKDRGANASVAQDVNERGANERPSLQEPSRDQDQSMDNNDPIIINSKFNMNEVNKIEYTPSSTMKNTYPYCCPICLSYFSTILITQCCKNYICHHCIDNMKKNIGKFEVACPTCRHTQIIVDDVDLGSSIRKYLDSPFATFKKSGQAAHPWISLEVIKEVDNQEVDIAESNILPPVLEYNNDIVQDNFRVNFHNTA